MIIRHKSVRQFRRVMTLSVLAIPFAACTPMVKVEAPDKPITVNLNINIQHDIRVNVDKQIDQLFDNEQLF